MATYFVRKTGSNSNAGTSAGAAWLTIGKALASGTSVVAGDTIYIGAGTYREKVVVAVSGSSGNPITVVGDVSGQQTGDAGDVIWSGWTIDDKTAPTAFTSTCSLNGQSFLTFQRLQIVGSDQYVVESGTGTSTNLIFQDCALLQGKTSNNPVVRLYPAASQAYNWTFERCLLTIPDSNFAFDLKAPLNSTADIDCVITIRNCTAFGGGGAQFVSLTTTGSGSFKPGGCAISNCLMFGFATANINIGAGWATSFPVLVSGCIVIGPNSTAMTANLSGQLAEDYNALLTGGRTNISIGPFTVTGYNPVTIEMGQSFVTGRGWRPFGEPTAGSPLLGFGNVVLAAGRAPTVIDDATVGTITWTSPANASVADATDATASSIPATTGVSHYLNAQGFNFSIPTTATIKSVRVEAVVSADAASAIACSNVKLIKAGVISGNDLASSNTTQFTTSRVIQSWGTTADPLWGLTLTPSDVNASTFGVVWAAKNTAGAIHNANVDMLRVIVAYTLSDGSGGVAVDMLNRPRPAGGGSSSYAIGALERGNTGVSDTATVHTVGTGAASIKLTGPSYHEFQVPVDAVSTTLTIYARYDTSANTPEFRILAAPELGISSDVVGTWSDPGTGAWAQISCAAQTPTAKGVVIVRIRNTGTSGTSNCWFDDVGVA